MDGAGRVSVSSARLDDVPARPRLRPGLRRAWRDPTTLQVGLGPGPAVVLSGVRAGDEAVISALDGTRDLAQLRRLAAGVLVGSRRLEQLLAVLDDARLIADSATSPAPDRADRAHLSRLGEAGRARLGPDADAWSLVHDVDGLRLAAARAHRSVQVRGAGRFGAALAATVVSAGVGRVELLGPGAVAAGDVLAAGAGAADVGVSWARSLERVRARLAGVPPSEVAHEGAGGPPDLVVLVGLDVLDARTGDDLVRRDVPHLGVVVATGRVVVGPLVHPGRSPCLRCLDLHRRDRDPAWPHVVAQLLAAGDAPAPVGETALSTAAAGVAALQVLAELDGRVTPDAVGRTIEVSLPQGAVRRRAWRMHPGCGCSRLPDPRPGERATPRNGSPERPLSPWPTMVS